MGCNGSGKTTLLKQIKLQCEKKEIPYVYYNNLTSGHSNSANRHILNGDVEFVARYALSSEGENIISNIGEICGKIGRTIRYKTDEKKEMFVLLDAIDSGLSVDNIIEIKRDMFQFITKDAKESNGIDIYFIAAANEYELARNERCLQINTLEYVDIPDYETYRNIIIQTRKEKNNRYGWEEFKGK